MEDKNVTQLAPATTIEGAVFYGVQGGVDKMFTSNLFKEQTQPQYAGVVYAGPPSGGAATPAFRPLVPSDIPDLSGKYLSSNGGYLVSPTITNATITFGTISGTSAVFSENELSIRDSVDTTRSGKFGVNIPAAGTSVVWNMPSITTDIVGSNTEDNLTNKRLTTRPSAASGAPLNIPPGSAPLSPVNGDIWTTPLGLYLRVNDTTQGPFVYGSSGSVSGVSSFNSRTGAVNLSSMDVRTALGYTPYNPGSSLVYTSANLTPSNLPDQTADFNIRKSNAQLTLGVASSNGGITSYGADGSGEVAVFSAHNGGSVALRPEGRTSTSGQLMVSASTFSWSGMPVVVSGSAQTVAGAKTFSGGIATPTLSVSGNVYVYSVSSGVAGLRYTSASGAHSYMNFNGDTGNVEVLSGTVTVGSSKSPVWHSGNFNPSAYAPLNNPSFTGNLTTTGYINASGGFGPGSDPRLKDESSLKVVDNAIDILYNLNVRKGKYHSWYNPDDKERYFIMADSSMERVAPEALLRDAVESGGNKYNGWSADQIIALLVQSVKELKEEVNAMKEKIGEPLS